MGGRGMEIKKTEDASAEEPSRGPSLVIIYSLVGLALVLATIFAGLIVLPFYLRR